MNRCSSWAVLVAGVLAVLVRPAAAGERLGGSESASSRPVPTALLQCTDRLLQSVDRAGDSLPAMTAAADVVARRWIGGAELFIGGDGSFAEEAFYRAGGLIGLRRIATNRKTFGGNGQTVTWSGVPAGSIVLYGLLHNTDPGIIPFDELTHIRPGKDTLVLFASSRWPTTRALVESLSQRLGRDHFFFIDTHLPTDTRLAAGSVRFGDTAPMATSVYTWTFTAELIAACTRAGRMPGVWPSLMIPHYEAWEQKYQKIQFHDDFRIGPIEAGVLGREYLQALRSQLAACPACQPQVDAAARLLDRVPADRTVYLMIESHLLAGSVCPPPELANWMLVQRGWRWPAIEATARRGDGVLWLGYLDWPAKEAQDAESKGLTFAGLSVRPAGAKVHDAPLVTPGEQSASPGAPPSNASTKSTSNAAASAPATMPVNVAWVHVPWRYPDAVIGIPGYPIKACPTSSIVQGVLLWGVIGDVLEDGHNTRKNE